MKTKTLKIYIEPASLPLTYELADYINSIDNESVSSVILFQRLKIKIDSIQNGRTIFIDNVNDNLELKLNSISKFIVGKSDSKIEIHTNIYREYDILFPLLKKIIPSVPFDRIVLHLYEDGTGTMLQRLTINKITEESISKTLSKRVNALRDNLINCAPIDSWNWLIIDNYLWHYFMDVKYHLIEPSNDNSNKNSFMIYLNDFTVPMSFSCNEVLNAKMSFIWNDIFNVKESLILKLKELSKDEKSILFLTSNYTDNNFREEYQNSLLDKITQLKSSGTLPCNSKIVYKGHPENIAFNNEICKALGENIIKLPESVPMEYFKLHGLLPKKVGGSFSSSMFSMDFDHIEFVILNGSKHDNINQKILELNLEYNCFDEKKITFLNEKIKNLNLNKKNRIFYSSASMGDIVYGSHAISSLRDYYPDEHFIFIVNNLYSDLIVNCPSIDECWDINNLTKEQLNCINEANISSRFHIFERWEQILSSLHMTNAFINEVNDSNIKITKDLKITISSEDKKYVDRFIVQNNLNNCQIVLLHPNNGAPNRTWVKNGWNELANLFSSHGWQVILIGSDHNKYSHVKSIQLDNQNTINAVNKFSILQTIYLMSQCQLLVACDSGPVALASYTDIAISALYSIIPSVRRLPYRHGSIGWNAHGINVECQYGQCGHLIMDANFHNRTLHKKWTLPTGKSFAEWCPNKNKYSCLRKFSHLEWWEEIMKFIKSDNFIMNKNTNQRIGNNNAISSHIQPQKK